MVGLIGGLEQPEALVVARDLQVGLDVSGGIEEERSARLPWHERRDVGREQVVQPPPGVVAADLHLPHVGEVHGRASLDEGGEIVGGSGEWRHRSGRISAPWTCPTPCS